MSEDYTPGVGVDIGTAFLCRARQKTDGKVEFISERDAFFMISPKTSQQAKLLEKTLLQRGAFTLKVNNDFYIVGQQAVELANERQEEALRPLKRGVLTAAEADSFGILAVVAEALVGKALVPNEILTYSFPANPIDEDYDVVFHRRRLDEIFRNLGYQPKGLLESEALAYSELGEDDLTGVVMSWGAGMVNVAVSFLGEILLSLAVARGGDYIDTSVGKTFNLPASSIQTEKESSLDLLAEYEKSTMEGRIKKNIVDYYDELMSYVLNVLELKLNKTKLPKFTKGVPIVLSGGTSMAKGFLERFINLAAEKKFPFEISEIRMAKDPLTAVANGCLISSQLED